MNIIKISNEDNYFKEIVNTYYEWWGHKYYDTLDKFYEYYKSCLTNQQLPRLYALLDNKELIGMYELNDHDRIEVVETPFLSNVYIKEEFRGKGYSKLLINDSIKETKKLGFNKLYLRSHHENYYEKFGFKLIKEVETSIGKKRIFEIEITH